ncbi:MAG: hypothetical protein ACP5GY_08195 [Vulcanisaeta sp.]
MRLFRVDWVGVDCGGSRVVVGVVEELSLLIIGGTVIAIEQGDDPRQVICTTPNEAVRLGWVKVNCDGKTTEILGNQELGIYIDSD